MKPFPLPSPPSYKVCRLAIAGIAMAASVFTIAPCSAGPLRGVEAVAENLPWFDSEQNYPAFDPEVARTPPIGESKRPNAVTAVTSTGRPPMDGPFNILLSRSVYPAEDGYLDVIVRFDMEPEDEPAGTLRLQLLDEAGEAISEDSINPIPGGQLYFSYAFPESLHGAAGKLKLQWELDGEERGRVEQEFEVLPQVEVERSGRIRIDLPNETGATMKSNPVTLGIPFPRGVLHSIDHLRLVDAEGTELPLQVMETAKWSRFGSVRWLLCDFAVDMDGGPTHLYLEYGEDVERKQFPEITVETSPSGPRIDLGRLRLEDGLWLRSAEEDGWRPLLKQEGFPGAFVEHANDREFYGFAAVRMRIPFGFIERPEQYLARPGDRYVVEETGPVKTVIRQEGWYEKPESGGEFCQYVIRYWFFNDSPVVRIFYTWIFTGDSSVDRISNMGWRFPLADEMEPIGFLSSFEENPEWLPGQFFLQYEHDAAEVVAGLSGRADREVTWRGGKGPGVMGAQSSQARIYLGIKDFWQNFPSELEFEDDGTSMAFHLWPRHNLPHRHGTRPENAHKLWFAHEGEILDLRLPQELATGDMFRQAAQAGPFWHYGRPETINAQGMAKTTEMWLYATDASESEQTDEAVKILHGLNDGGLRAVVDPKWIASTGVFPQLHPYDPENFAQEEEVFETMLGYLENQKERMGVYGMWIYGDFLREPDLDQQTASLRRAYRKSHWGWPYSWIPYIRSGSTEYLKNAEAATRMMSDVAFVHYVDEELQQYYSELPYRHGFESKPVFRLRGWHNRNIIPWAGYWGPTARMYVDEAEYLWHAWFITGYRRAKDVAMVWAEETKLEYPDYWGRGPITAAQNRARWPINLQKQYLEMYENTFDPWFLAAAHAIAELHLHRYSEQAWAGVSTAAAIEEREEDDEGWAGHPWNTGPRDFQLYTGDPHHEEWYMHFVNTQSDWQERGWASQPSNTIHAIADGYRITGDPVLLQRAAGIMDLVNWAVYQGEPWYYNGYYLGRHVEANMNFLSWYQKWFPLLPAILAEADEPVVPMPISFDQNLSGMTVLLRKEADQPVRFRVNGAFQVENQEGQTVLEVKETEGRETFLLDADLPEGVYRVLPKRAVQSLPISEPGTREVLLLDEARQVGRGQEFSQHWFLIPEGVESFWLEFENSTPYRQPVRQVIVWNADGEEVWAHRQATIDYQADQETIRAEIPVPVEQAGRLWRLTLPGMRSMHFTMDPALSPVLAHSPERWFDPSDSVRSE